MNFLTGRTQAVVVEGEGTTSNWLLISRIVQGSWLGPILFVVYAMDLDPISEHNRILKYADDTTLLVAEKSSVDVAIEFGHLKDWSRHNKLTINKDKTVETRICAAEMAVRYAALSACRKVHVCHCNSLGGAT